MSADPQAPQAYLDPVCGMTVTADSPHHHVHGGVDYYFCAAGCRDRFAANPSAYLKQSDRALDALLPDLPAGTRWICPMDPGVESDRPGPCPICGMALEAADPAAVPGGDEDAELRAMRRRFVACAPLAAIVMGIAMHDMIGLTLPYDTRSLAYVQLLLATPIVTWGAAPFYARAWTALRRARANMFTLIALGVLAAYALSVAALFAPAGSLLGTHDAHGPALYFESAAVIVSLVLLGQWLEQRARRRSAAALRGLLELVPAVAFLLEGDEEHEIPVAHVRPGDLLRIKPGGKIPVDGSVVEGLSTVDESSLRGEPIPVEKGPGAALMAGTINGTGILQMRAERVGRETLLAQVVARVAAAQRSRAPIQSLADRVAAVFVPLVVLAAVATAVIWTLVGPEPALLRGLYAAIAVLVIACPCALGLATPMSILVGMGRGAELGVLFRDAEALQRFSEVDALVLDKTGTLTAGQPRLAAILSRDEVDDDELLAQVAGLERVSEHPLAAAIVAAAQARNLKLPLASNVRVHPGRGVAGQVVGVRLALGNEAMMQAEGVDPTPISDSVEKLRAEGKTALYVARDRKLVAAIAIEDPLREDTLTTVRDLHAAGLRLLIVSGDNAITVAAIARELKITEWHADVLPEAKADVVERLKRSGHVVAMAGDGINDAAALASADVGVALASGSDIAMQSASVVLVHGDLRAILRARQLSSTTLKNIRQNLGFAFGYNLLAVPIAAGALYPFFGWLLSPMIAAAAMSFSSLSVVANALRLRRA